MPVSSGIQMPRLSIVMLMMASLAYGKAPCDCLDGTFTYDGVDYEGCTETPDWVGHNWCYVHDGATCISALDSTVEGETRKYRECSSCNCQTQWNYLGAEYEGCAETPDWADHNWCYVQGGSHCNTALDSTVAGEDRKYRECSSCNCMTGWNYQGAMYEGCAETPDWADHNWCYVQGGSNCNTALDSTVEGEDRKYQECEVPTDDDAMTCGDVKALFKSNDCCGNMNKIFNGMRRLSDRSQPQHQALPQHQARLLAEIRTVLQSAQQSLQSAEALAKQTPSQTAKDLTKLRGLVSKLSRSTKRNS